ncbi:desumoylating isopeptidase 1-like protein [Tanacetum coccineum]
MLGWCVMPCKKEVKIEIVAILSPYVSSPHSMFDALCPPTIPLGDARSKVQKEIRKEFVAMMTSGTICAIEAAAVATKKVMQKFGHINAAQS